MTAADFMASSVAANERLHAPLFPGVVDFLVADVCLMTVPPGSYDVVFSNWLLMYLSDGEVAAFARKALTWLAPGGTLFFRESCFRQSGDRARGGFNPTHYRNPRDYFAAFDGAAAYVDGEGGEERRRQQQPGGGENGGGENGAAAANGNGNGNGASNGNGSGSEKKKRRTRRVAYFELDVAKCVDTYVAVKGNQNQICWRYVRREADVEEAEAGAAVPAAAAAGPPAPPPPPPRPRPARAASTAARTSASGDAPPPPAAPTTLSQCASPTMPAGRHRPSRAISTASTPSPRAPSADSAPTTAPTKGSARTSRSVWGRMVTAHTKAPECWADSSRPSRS